MCVYLYTHIRIYEATHTQPTLSSCNSSPRKTGFPKFPCPRSVAIHEHFSFLAK